MPLPFARAFRSFLACSPFERDASRRQRPAKRPAGLAFGLLVALAGTAHAAHAQYGGPPWSVGILPSAQAQTSQTVAVTITWCDKSYSMSSSRTILFRGVNVTQQFSFTNLGFGVHDCAQFYSGTAVYGAKSTGTVTLTGGQTIDTLVASIYNGNGALLSGTKTWMMADYQVSVTPHGGRTAPAPNAAGLTQTFTVANYGNASATYALQVVTCTGGVSGCSAPGTVTVWPGTPTPVNVSYTSGAADTKGTIELKASYTGSTSVWADVGTVNASVTATAIANTRVLVGEVNPGTTINRASCLVFSLGRDLASECGALRVTHALPSVRTLNKTRTPTLVYYGDQVQGPVLAAHLILADTATIPQSVQLNVKEVLADGSTIQIAGLPRTYAGTAWASNRAQRLSAALPVSGTRILTYQVDVQLLYAGAWRPAAPIVTGEMAIVNRLASRFGAGWWLAGVERLYPGQQGGAVLWVAGDGSTRKYVRSGTLGTDTTYLAESLSRPDTLFRDALGVYRRSLPNGVRTYFDGTGLHTRTVNRLGHVTQFVWGAVSGEPRLDGLIVPAPAGTSRSYQFRYDGNEALYSILAPQNPGEPREVLLTRTSTAPGRGVERITDPDMKSESFAFKAATDFQYSARIDRRLTRTDFGSEANAPTLAYSSTPTGAGETIRQDFRTVTGIGADATTGPLSVDSAYFRYTNPRGAVSKVWSDRLGSPTKLVNALGHTTTVRHDDWRFPALVSRVEYPVLVADGRQRLEAATFDARGNLKATSDINPYGVDGNNRDAVTRYEYDNVSWPTFVTRIVARERDSVVIEYDGDGNIATQRDARGDSTRVFFHYDNPWKLLSTIWQGGNRTDSLDYSSRLFNLNHSRTASNVVTTFAQDSIGRDTLYQEVINPASSVFRTRQTYYDLVDQVTGTVTTGDATPGADSVPKQWLYTLNAYDGEGNLKSLTRWSYPDVPFSTALQPTGIGRITTRWDYDLLNRKTREYAPDATPNDSLDNPFDETRYDLASNVDTIITRGRDALHRDTLTMAYDTLDRLRKRVVPGVTYDKREGLIQKMQATPNSWYGEIPAERDTWYPRYPNNTAAGYTIPLDTAFFDYDELGNLTRADNRDALVHRGYYLNGLVKADTLTTRTVAEVVPNRNMGTAHVYVLTSSYDLDGRRTMLGHPTQLAPSATQKTTKYEYNSGGYLASLTDALGYRYNYEYNGMGQLTKSAIANRSLSYEQYAYDGDGHLVSDVIYDGATYSGSELRKTTFTYLNGRLDYSRNASGTKDTTWATYSGLGQLVQGALTSNGSAYSAHSVEGRDYKLDALGNIHRSLYRGLYTEKGNGPLTPTTDEARAFEPGTGRLVAVDPNVNMSDRRDTTYYDASGNVTFETARMLAGISPQYVHDRASYYGADGKLRAVDARGRSYGDGAFTSAFDEYRYDALGRRILVLSKRYCYKVPWGGDCNVDWVRRTVWDGSAEVYEIQMALDPSNIENDGAPVAVPVEYLSTDGSYFDPNPFYGRVAYGNALGIDRPQSVIRMGYVSMRDIRDTVREQSAASNYATPVSFAPFPITPMWDARGQPELGIYTDVGQGMRCQTVSGRPFCVRLKWPAKWLAYIRSQYQPASWLGSLLNTKQDATGLNYLRNRYYDPGTGRFTQQDPIGLAGGLNSYGFANGDPVNFSDPFGLYAQIQCRTIPKFGGVTAHCGLRIVNKRLGVNMVFELTRAGDINTFYNPRDWDKYREGAWTNLAVPKGSTEDEFDQALTDAYRNLSGPRQGTPYHSGECSNSNQFIHQVVREAGGDIPKYLDHWEPRWIFGAPGLNVDCSGNIPELRRDSSAPHY